MDSARTFAQIPHFLRDDVVKASEESLVSERSKASGICPEF